MLGFDKGQLNCEIELEDHLGEEVDDDEVP